MGRTGSDRALERSNLHSTRTTSPSSLHLVAVAALVTHRTRALVRTPRVDTGALQTGGDALVDVFVAVVSGEARRTLALVRPHRVPTRSAVVAQTSVETLVDVVSAGGSGVAREAGAALGLRVGVVVAESVSAVAVLLTMVTSQPRLARDARELCSAAALEVTCLLADVTRASVVTRTRHALALELADVEAMHVVVVSVEQLARVAEHEDERGS